MRSSTVDNGVQNVKSITSALGGLNISSRNEVEVRDTREQEGASARGGVDINPINNGNGSNSKYSTDAINTSSSNNKSTKSRRNRKKNKPNGGNSTTNNNNNESSHVEDTVIDIDVDIDNSNDNSRAFEDISAVPVSSVSIAPSISNNGAFVYSGNNIVLVSNDDFENGGTDTQEIPPSCIDNTGPIGESQSHLESRTIISEETSILGLDLESEYDEDDSTQRAASWCLANANQTYSSSDHQNQSTTTGGDPYPMYSYQSASAFQIGPVDSVGNNRSGTRDGNNYNYNYNYNPTKKVKSADSESNTSCSSIGVPAFAYCATFLDELTNCEAQGCSSLSNIKCAQCLSAFYCNEDHQKISWPHHKKGCTPYRMEEVAMGAADLLPVWVAVASRNLAEGQEVFEDKAMLVFPLADSSSDNQFDHVLDLTCVISRTNNGISSVSCMANRPACLGCMRVVEFIGPPRYQCSKCRLPLCSYNCQFLIAHQAGECDAVSSQNASGDDDIFALSCHHTLYMDVEILRALQLEVYDNLQWDRLLNMKNNVRVDTYKKTDRFKLFAQNIASLVPFSAKFSGYNLDLIMDVHAIISSLSFRPSLTSSFKLLFPKQPVFAHDCVPNTFHYIKDEHTGDQNRMKLVTKAASTIIEGEIITIDFTPSPYLPYPRRKKILHDHLSISNCLCTRCQNPRKLQDLTADIKCPSCRVGMVYPEVPSLWEESVWSCDKCFEEISYCKVDAVENDCQKEIACFIPQSTKMAVSNLTGFITRRGKLDLNPDHCLIIMAWCFVESFLRSRLKAVRKPDPTFVYSEETLNEFKLLGEYVEVMEKHMNAIRPGVWIDRGIVLFHKFYSSFVQLSREYQDRKINRKDFIQRCLKCLKILQKALETLSLYEGYNSPLVSQLTQEVTSALTDLKRYVQHLFMQDSNENLPLPSFKQIGIGE